MRLARCRFSDPMATSSWASTSALVEADWRRVGVEFLRGKGQNCGKAGTLNDRLSAIGLDLFLSIRRGVWAGSVCVCDLNEISSRKGNSPFSNFPTFYFVSFYLVRSIMKMPAMGLAARSVLCPFRVARPV